MQHPIAVAKGAMVGRIGRLVWFNGSDMDPDDYMNTMLSRGACRFGSIYFLPDKPDPALFHLLGIR